MARHRAGRWAPGLALLAVLLFPGAGSAAGVTLELNRLEPLKAGCRMHMVLGNTSGARYSSYRIDLVIFGKDGVVARRTILDASPLRESKTSVHAFDVAALGCEGFGRVLLNDVVECRTAKGPVDDCVSMVSVSSRAGVELTK